MDHIAAVRGAIVRFCFDLHVPYLPVYKLIPCTSRPPIFDGKKAISSISGTVDSQKIKALPIVPLIDFTLTPDDFTRQWGTPRG